MSRILGIASTLRESRQQDISPSLRRIQFLKSDEDFAEERTPSATSDPAQLPPEDCAPLEVYDDEEIRFSMRLAADKH